MSVEATKRLFDARVACEQIASYVEGESAESCLANESLQLIVERLLITVGEAIDVALRQADGSFAIEASGQITGLRNRIVHRYDNIQQEVIRDTAINDMPILLPHLRSLLNQAAGTDTNGL